MTAVVPLVWHGCGMRQAYARFVSSLQVALAPWARWALKITPEDGAGEGIEVA